MDQRPAGVFDRPLRPGTGLGPHRLPHFLSPRIVGELRHAVGTRRTGRAGCTGRPGEVWDRILVSADGGTIPTQLTDQLADGGRMVIPAAGRMAVITREGEGIHTDYLPGRWAFVKLR